MRHIHPLGMEGERQPTVIFLPEPPQGRPPVL
jgi:hypothetical protein